MITFARNGNKDCTKVFAKIDTGLPTSAHVFPFEWDCVDAEYAALLEAHLQKRLRDTIEQAHRLAYDRGWKDAKSRKAKKATHFAAYFVKSAGVAVAW